MSDLIEMVMLMEGATVQQASHAVQLARNEVLDGADPVDVLLDRFGLDDRWVKDLTK